MKKIKIFCCLATFLIIDLSCGFKNKTYTTLDRIKHFEQVKLNTDQPVEVLWSPNLIPRIKAENSKDLFYTLGAVQVHLRRNQLEMYRKLSQGNLSEMAGPTTLKIDKFLKSIDFQHAAEISLKMMSASSVQTLQWMSEGMNDYIKQSKYKSKDLSIMNIKNKPWTPLDLVRVFKFTSVDVNWMVVAQLLEFKSTKFLDKVWDFKINEQDFFDEFLKEQALQNSKQNSNIADAFNSQAKIAKAFKPKHFNQFKSSNLGVNTPKDKITIKDAFLDINKQDHSSKLDISFLDYLQNITKSGSNAFAVQGTKTKNQAAIVSNDPHLGLMIPNIWLFVVLDSPEYKTMGYIIPSFPVPVIGRNENIGWGGTNLWGISTYPLTLKDTDRSKLTSQKVPLKIRFWPDSKFTIYKLGEYPVFKTEDFPEIGDKDIVFRWHGFHPSDELETFLKVNKAQNFSEFHQAFKSYAVAGMTFVYGDKAGNVGKVIATTQPQVNKLKLFYQPNDFSGEVLNSLTLPVEYNPDSEFVVSANDYTKGLKQPLSLFQAPQDRKDRMTFLLKNQNNFSLEDVKTLHKDVFSATAFNLKNDLVKFLSSKNWVQNSDLKYLKTLDSWSGKYEVDSKGALFFEIFLAAWSEDIIKNLCLKDIESNDLKNKAYDFLTKNFNYRNFLSRSLIETDFLTPEKFKLYFERTKFIFEKYQTWGAFHRMDLRHPLGNLKLFKLNYSYYDQPWAGGNETLMKAAHKLSTKTAKVSFGAQARWMTDLKSMDENYLMYLGGQDGFIGSAHINDLTSKWVEGDYLRVPFDRDEFKKNSATMGQ